MEEDPQRNGRWVHSACAMCLAAPMKVKVKNGKVVEVTGEDVPGWNGVVCGKAVAGTGERIYGPDRILYPLKRVGERGEAKFVRCTWEEIINEVASKCKQYIDLGHPEYFAIWWGCPEQTDHVPFLHYWSAIVGATISYLHGQVCFGDSAVEKMVTFGGNHGHDLVSVSADWPHTKYAVLAGQNFPGTATSGACNIPLYRLANKAKENGCRFVIIDPKLTDSAPWCHEWIPIAPGNDAIFALGVCQVLINEELYDESFLLEYTNAPQLIRTDNGQALKDTGGNYLCWDVLSHAAKPLPEAGRRDGLTLGLGKTFKVIVDGEKFECRTVFQFLAEEVEKYSPKTSPLGGKAIEIARKLGGNKPSVIFSSGFTSGRYSNWFQIMRAYSVVNLLLGNFDKPGGFYFYKHGFNLGNGWPEPPQVPEYRDSTKLVPGPWGNLMSIENIDKRPVYCQPREFHPATVALPWLHFDAIQQGKIRAVFSSAENAAISQTNLEWVEECLKQLDLIIVSEQSPKEFVDLADYVIPEASYLERYHLYQRSYIGTDEKERSILYMRSEAIPPQGESKPVSWFLVEVARKLGLGKYFEALDLNYDWWNRMLKHAGLYPKITAEKLVDEGPYVEEYPMTYNLLVKPIATRSGRFEMYSNELAEECYYNGESRWHLSPHVYPLPVHIPIAEPQGDDEFYLISGKATWHQKSATQHNFYLMEDAIEGGSPYTAIYMNTGRANKLGINDGDLVEVQCVGPTKKADPCVYNEAPIGNKERARVRVTEGLHPKAAWIYFAGGHKSKSMLAKAGKGIAVNFLVPTTVSPYAGGVGKNYSIVKIRPVKGDT